MNIVLNNYVIQYRPHKSVLSSLSAYWMEDGGFTVVKKKKGARKKGSGLKRTTVIADNSEPDIDKSSVVARIEAARKELLSSEYWAEFVSVTESALTKVEAVYCFGLGHFSDSVTAKYQFALLLCIQERFNIAEVQLSDPVFYRCERDLLSQHFHLEVLSQNSECRQPCSQPSLVFLPHCPKQMTNNLLFSNWEPRMLSNLFLISNSLSNINNNEDLYFIKTVNREKFVEESCLRNIFKYQDIFNDLSLHRFTIHNSSLESPVWSNFTKPQYNDNDVEFITASKELI